MKALKFLLPTFLNLFFMISCNDNNSDNAAEGTSPGVNDTTTTNPTDDAMDYHPDQRQQIPTTDSSNTIGTDTTSGSVATPNTGTQKSYNDKKGSSDSAK